MKVQKIIRLEQDRACLMCGAVTPAGEDALPLALHLVICLECCEKAAYAVWIHGLGGPALSAAIQAAMPAVAIHQQHAEVLPECTAVDMIPLSEGPPQSCALRGPHTEHVAAGGHRFTVPEKPSCPQECAEAHTYAGRCLLAPFDGHSGNGWARPVVPQTFPFTDPEEPPEADNPPADALPECPAALLPLGDGDPQRCVLSGPHTDHVTAAGGRFTVPQEHVQEHGAAVLPDDQLWPVPGVPRV